MRILRIAVVLSFLVPLMCEVGNALAAPMHPCGKTTHSEPSPSQDLPCCLSALLQRSAVRSPQVSLGFDQAASPAVLTPDPLVDVSCTVSVIARTADTPEHAPPPRELYTINASFLI